MYRNDPYPRPGQDDWNDIKHKFLEASQQILKRRSAVSFTFHSGRSSRAVVGSRIREKPGRKRSRLIFWLAPNRRIGELANQDRSEATVY